MIRSMIGTAICLATTSQNSSTSGSVTSLSYLLVRFAMFSPVVRRLRAARTRRRPFELADQLRQLERHVRRPAEVLQGQLRLQVRGIAQVELRVSGQQGTFEEGDCFRDGDLFQ